MSVDIQQRSDSYHLLCELQNLPALEPSDSYFSVLTSAEAAEVGIVAKCTKKIPSSHLTYFSCVVEGECKTCSQGLINCTIE